MPSRCIEVLENGGEPKKLLKASIFVLNSSFTAHILQLRRILDVNTLVLLITRSIFRAIEPLDNNK